MSHQRYPSHDLIKEPHSVSVKVLRLSQPSLVTQHPLESPFAAAAAAAPSSTKKTPHAPASLAYSPSAADTNPDPFLLSPILNLPASFGSAYVGETFSCTLCANNDLPADGPKRVRDVRIEAEMKTPGLGGPQRLELGPATAAVEPGGGSGTDLEPGATLQKVVGFDLKEEGNHVLAVTVSYYEATETSGRTRTFRKLYQFICKSSLIVRTKVSSLGEEAAGGGGGRRRWILEAQLENCSEDVMQLNKVVLDAEEGLSYQDCNWDSPWGGGGGGGEGGGGGSGGYKKPVLHPGEVEQVCFVVQEKDGDNDGGGGARVTAAGRVIFGVLSIGWRGEMGSRGFLSTGKLGARVPSR